MTRSRLWLNLWARQTAFAARARHRAAISTSRLIRTGGLLAVLLWLGMPVEAATHTANSCNAPDVQAKVNAAVDGDIVVIPNGSCTWTATSFVTISGKGIHLRGATAGGVVITTAGGSNAAIVRITEDATHHVEVSQLSFRETNNDFYVITVSGVGNGKPVLIHHNTFGGFNSVRGMRFYVSRGVVYENRTQAQTSASTYNNRQFFNCQITQAPPNAWTALPVYGANDTTGTNSVYVEDNEIINVQEAIDLDGNCRGVVRYNVFQDAFSGSHGADTGPYGVRHFEIYNNTFIRAANSMLVQWFMVRGGSGVITDNVFPDIVGKAEINMQIQNLRRNGGPYPCWKNGWPAPHQVGQGYNGSTNVVEGVYIWNNTGGGNPYPVLTNYSPDECGGGHDISAYIQHGRDFFVGTPKPGYTKYRYPHPMRSSTSGGTSSGTMPSAPQNLRITSE